MILIFPNIEGFNTWHASVMDYYDLPNETTQVYANGAVHPETSEVACNFTDDLPQEFKEGVETSDLSLNVWLYGDLPPDP